MGFDNPNIVLIMTDQQRWDTIHSWGYDYMVTPNMDRLSSRGTSFRQAYCPGATCVASRAAIFTGMYAHNTGVYTFSQWSKHRTWVEDLAKNGYFCANIGKMHHIPIHTRGAFHERIIVENPANTAQWEGGPDDDWGHYLSLNGFQRPNHRQNTDPDWMRKFQSVPWHLPEEMHSDVFIGRSAVSWIENYRGAKPFFLQVGFTGPHEPWDPLPRHLQEYADRDMPKAQIRDGDLENKPPQQRAHKEYFMSTQYQARIDLDQATEDDIRMMRKHYYASITTVDEQLGAVLDALDRQGYLENSVIIFCSDHGDMLGDHTLPFKWLMYDPIVHIPLIICDPRNAQAPQVVHDLVSLIDLGPTILNLAGIDIPDYLEGISLLPYLIDEAPEPQSHVLCEDNYLIMLRSKSHKLVYYIGQDIHEFYDLESDPNEFENLWADPTYQPIRDAYVFRMLEYITKSSYFTQGYKRTRSQKYTVRWHADGNYRLHSDH